MTSVSMNKVASRKMVIGGRLQEGASRHWMETVNPATGEVIANVPLAGLSDVDDAVQAAEAAQPEWASLSVAQRAALMGRLADALSSKAGELLTTEVTDTGNTITGMNGDVKSCIERLRYFSGLGTELQGRTVPERDDKLNLTLREPYGVVGRIVAFNHPLSMATHGIASPLIAGNCVVLKPSDQCPLSALMLGEIANDVLPPGVLNVVTGNAATGDALVRHPRVKRLSFVGSVRTGLAIQRAAAEVAVKHLSLELGGKNPFIAFPDADVEEVAVAAVAGMNFTWQGQSCSSTSRLFLHEAIHDRVLERVAELAAKIRIGNPLEWDSEMGALISPGHLQNVERFVHSARSEGAKLVTGGERPRGSDFERGNWYRPTVFAEVRPDMRIAREEIFGPVLSVFKWINVDEVISLANAVDVGLTAAIFTNDLKTAMSAAKRLQSGHIWVNGVNAGVRGVPFGGFKNSGIGRERGIEELYSFTEEKSIQFFL